MEATMIRRGVAIGLLVVLAPDVARAQLREMRQIIFGMD